MNSLNYKNSFPKREPDVEGPGGRAWAVKTKSKRKHGGVAHFLVHAVNGNPFWNWYVVSVVHLRAEEGLPQPHIQFPGASHELLMAALNPEEKIPDIDNWKGMSHLEPIDQCVQFIVNNDEQAKSLCDDVIRAIVVGGISPDQDFRSWWKQSVNQTAEHYRLGEHPDD